MSDERDLLIQLLKEEIIIIDRAIANLKKTNIKCSRIHISKEMSDVELEIFDSLSARFVRVYEVYIKQLLRTVLRVFGEYENTFIDNLNKAEKLNLINRVEVIEQCRKLRNILSHEYLAEEWPDIYRELIRLIPQLLESIDMIRRFLKARSDIVGNLKSF